MRATLLYVHEFRDRHGHVRRYFRRRGFPTIALPGEPSSAEFIAAYSAALAGCEVRAEKDRSAPGTVSAAIGAYYTSGQFRAFAPATQKMRRAILERFRQMDGDKRLAMMRREHVARRLADKTPLAARNWIKTLRGLMQFAVEIGLRRDDPTVGIKPAKVRPSSGFHDWTEDEIAQFEAHHPVGSKARLAMALMLYSGQRRGDAVKLGPQHIRGGVLYMRQSKTGAALAIPVHPALAAVIAASEVGNLAFLVTAYGRPFTPAGFGNLFREWCDEAGLPQCAAHGLRKAACRRLAETGCTAPQIAAISGHKTLAEVQRYIAAADQAKLAEAAMVKLTERIGDEKVATPGIRSGNPH